MKSVTEFREKISLDCSIFIKEKKYKIKQIVKFQLANNDFYYKLFLSENCVLADDLENNYFIFVREIRDDLKIVERPIIYKNQKFDWLYSEPKAERNCPTSKSWIY